MYGSPRAYRTAEAVAILSWVYAETRDQQSSEPYRFE